MKNYFALLVGVGLIAVALAMALNSSSQDSSSQPQVARALATEFHTTPSATPTATATLTPTLTPTVTPTPIHLASRAPSAEEVLAFLFQFPTAGVRARTRNARVEMTPLVSPDGTTGLVVTGDRLEGGRGLQVGSGVFGVVLVWQDGEYLVRFRRIMWAHGYDEVGATVTEGGEVAFHFQPLTMPGLVPGWTRDVRLTPCGEPAASPTTVALDQPTDVEWRCY